MRPCGAAAGGALVTRGYLAFILHAHLPFVRHPEHERFLEEDWLFEAITETYIPLIHVFEGLERDGISFRLTMTLSPSLLSMLEDPLLIGRYVEYLDRLLELTDKEIVRTRGDERFHELAWMYNRRLSQARRTFVERYGGRLVRAFRGVQDRGHLEIVTCGATHGFLPLLLDSPRAVRAQVAVAVAHYRRLFGRDPRGIWLPECGYHPDVEPHLQEQDLRYFILDHHGLLLADPAPVYGIHAPVFTPHGLAAFARDVETSKQVWSAQEGYPGDPVYRDFYRDIGFDLDFEYVRPYIHPDGIRIYTGLKYYAITGRTVHKVPYDPRLARERAAVHAANFQFNRERQVEYLASRFDRPPLIICPYDAELFGHWWFEGPIWLDYVIRKISCDVPWIELITPSDYLRRHPTNQICRPNPSSWGANGYYQVWLNQSNAWIYPHLHGMARQMTEAARRFVSPTHLEERCLNQMARELLLAQSSDWAFIMNTGTAVEYAQKRVRSHISRFPRLHGMLTAGRIDEDYLGQVELRDTIFPEIDYRVYR
jgi:1,4-alpha-glucan branching enzyme